MGVLHTHKWQLQRNSGIFKSTSSNADKIMEMKNNPDFMLFKRGKKKKTNIFIFIIYSIGEKKSLFFYPLLEPCLNLDSF